MLPIKTPKNIADELSFNLGCSVVSFIKVTDLHLKYFESYSLNTIPTPMHDDYIYLSHEMATLPKNKFRKKIQQINKILLNHEYEVLNIGIRNISICEDILLQCNNNISTEGIQNETRSVHTLLENFEFLDCEGILVYVDNKPVAFSIGEQLDSSTYVIHVEKGLKQHQGIYQMMFLEFSKRISKKYTYINKEQDLGVPGLKQAKMSYGPYCKLNKYIISSINDAQQ